MLILSVPIQHDTYSPVRSCSYDWTGFLAYTDPVTQLADGGKLDIVVMTMTG